MRRFREVTGRSQGEIGLARQLILQSRMNKPMKSSSRSQLTFGDLVVAVSSCSRNSREATVAIADLLLTRRVVIGHRQMPRARH